ncbi:MAG TPA: CoA transferase [Xanthobacteraceae bacterium]|jgi:crotonobetainyl-CoA:carnitine CoA-transferase CaiB-like acyl-CoA transferase|nr:CoA transferase [Xanthobacteraceae bacterium]
MTAATPLSDITVIELGHSVAAPYAGEILGDLGATVIKIEKRDGGDDARQWAPPYWHGLAAIFQSLNRNKLSCVVDLRDPRERDLLTRLIVERADVLIQNLRPGMVEELGLDAATLRARNKRLIYCGIGAFGRGGPLSGRPGYDPLMQAFGGLMSVTGEAGEPPVRVGTSIIDMGAGLWSVIGILSALHHRTLTGAGTTVDTSLYETALAWMSYHAANYQASGEVPRRHGSGTFGIVPYRGYATSDGHLVIGAGNDNLFRKLAVALGHPEWADDPRFLDNPKRVHNRVALDAMIEEATRTKATAAWQAILEAAGVPSAPMQSVDQVLAHPQTQALGMLQQSPDGRLTIMGLPLSFDGERPPFRRAAPKLGEHTEELLAPPAAQAKTVSRR